VSAGSSCGSQPASNAATVTCAAYTATVTCAAYTATIAATHSARPCAMANAAANT
jgi:hypothetical protein